MSYRNSWAGKYKSIGKLRNRLRIKGKTEGTINQHIIAVKQFLDFHKYKNPDKLLEQIQEKKVDFNDLIEEFVVSNIDRGLGRKTLRQYVSYVEKWLQYNDVDVHIKEAIRPEGRTRRPLSDRSPTREELKNLMNHAYIRDKTIIEVASSSGLRIGTLLGLKVGDVDFGIDPEIARINVCGGDGRKLKFGQKYFTFITPEARRYLEKYLQERRNVEKFNRESPLFMLHFNIETDKRIGKPLGAIAFRRQWHRLLKRSGLDEKDKPEGSITDWYVLHFHTLRKYFMTQCVEAGVKTQYYNFWMGHKQFDSGQNDSAYFRPEGMKHIEEYKKAIQNLSIEEYKAEEIKEEVKGLLNARYEQDKRIEKLEQELEVTHKMLMKMRELEPALKKDQIQREKHEKQVRKLEATLRLLFDEEDDEKILKVIKEVKNTLKKRNG